MKFNRVNWTKRYGSIDFEVTSIYYVDDLVDKFRGIEIFGIDVCAFAGPPMGTYTGRNRFRVSAHPFYLVRGKDAP